MSLYAPLPSTSPKQVRATWSSLHSLVPSTSPSRSTSFKHHIHLLNRSKMLTRRIARASSSLTTANAIRPFTSSASFARTPSLGDITPNGVPAFEAKQKQFREKLAEQTKKEISKSSSSMRVLLQCPSHCSNVSNAS